MAKGETYEEFVEKFKPKKTTDDCYTPNEIYEAVKNYATKKYNWEDRTIVRPFYPGGDYENYDYPKNCVVIDNPPFSIISKIVTFYEENKIDYFLFAPHLTLLQIRNATSHICVGTTVIYENGAKVNTSFVCSKGAKIKNDPDLYEMLGELAPKKALLKYEYPKNLVTSSLLEKFNRFGVEYEEDNYYHISSLDEQKERKKRIYGSGYIVPTENITNKLEELEANITNKLEELEAKKKKRKIICKWQLSEREKNIVKELDKQQCWIY